MYKKITVQMESIGLTDTLIMKNTQIAAYMRKKGDFIKIISSVDLPNMQVQMDEQLYYVLDYTSLEFGTSFADVYDSFEYAAELVSICREPTIIKVYKYVGNPELHRLYLKGCKQGKSGLCIGEVNIAEVLGYVFFLNPDTIEHLEVLGSFEVLAKLSQYVESCGDFDTQNKIDVILEAHNRCKICGCEQFYDEAYYKSTGLWKCPTASCC